MSLGRIRLKNGDREIELEGDRLLIEELLARYAPWVQGGMPPEIACPPALSPDEERELAELPRVPASFRVQTTLTVEDFLALKAPRFPMGRLLVLAYYQEKYQHRPSYSPGELAAWWQEVWPAEPFNSELCQEALDQGYFEWAAPEALTLTFTGQAHVRDGLA